jgi:hypothetical protein
MKTPLLAAALCALAALPAALHAAPLTQTAAVQSRPEASAPVIAYLKAGSEAVPADASAQTAPGWLAVKLPGPFEGYVQNKDLGKSLDVRPGGKIYQHPTDDAAVLTTAVKGDHIRITGIRGRWVRVSLSSERVGYIQQGIVPGPVSPAPEALPVTAAPEAAAAPAGMSGHPAPGFGGDSAGKALFPRLVEGKFASTRNLLPFKKPYEWQLLDDSGSRKAYLDVSRLLQTDQMDRYVNRGVVVTGTMRELENGKDMVVEVESLSLK